MTPSLALEIAAQAREMTAAGKDVINLSLGEPDYPTPRHIKDAGIDAIERNITRYTAGVGTPELRQAIADRYQHDYGVEYSLSEIAVSNGAKHSISNLIMALCEEGHEVIIPTPGWLAYPDMIYLAQAEPVFLDTTPDTQFKLTPAMLEEAITDRTRIVILNTPNNPTGMVYSREEMAGLVEVIARHPQVYILSDEVYSRMVYGDNRFCSLVEFQEIRKQALVVNGVSKAYCMTGWRIGYMLAPVEVVRSVGVIQSQITSSPNAIAQHASVTAMGTDPPEVTDMFIEYERRSLLAHSLAEKLPLVESTVPQGAFYLFLDVTAYMNSTTADGETITDSAALAGYLLQEALVAVIPGKAFFRDGFIRLSFASTDDKVKAGIERIGEALKKLTVL
jgi:aspartate aminotransferase